MGTLIEVYFLNPDARMFTIPSIVRRQLTHTATSLIKDKARRTSAASSAHLCNGTKVNCNYLWGWDEYTLCKGIFVLITDVGTDYWWIPHINVCILMSKEWYRKILSCICLVYGCRWGIRTVKMYARFSFGTCATTVLFHGNDS